MTHSIIRQRPLVSPAVPRSGRSASTPLGLDAVTLDREGTLGAWQDLNARSTIPHCVDQLEASGVIDNFRRVVRESSAEHRGFVFADSDLYKVIEAIGWEIGRSGTDRWDGYLDDVIDLITRVQEPSGYLHTWIQGVHPEKKLAELEWTHELYCLGHLVQASIALSRGAGRDDLLAVAERFVALVDQRFGPGREDGVCGHPEIETALIELYRLTGNEAHLRLAERQIDLRGRGLLKVGSLGARYFQDHVPVRAARTAVGHAVRQLYLNAGATDLYLETGEDLLFTAMRDQWSSAHERKMYISGAFGSRHRDEAFGDDYELPSDRAYAETCASIAGFQWAWRMLLATAESTFADTMERELHNAIAAAVDRTGTRFFYSNPLQMRPDRYSEENAPRERTHWYACACCPPNIARLVASLGAYVATASDDGLQLHLYAPGRIDLPAHLGSGHVDVRTTYPWEGSLRIDLTGELAPGFHLDLRIPAWSHAPRLLVDGKPVRVQAEANGYLTVDLGNDGARSIELDLGMAPRWTRAHHKVDAVRGCLALERGPLLFCLEQADLPDALVLEDMSVLAGEGVEEHRRDGDPLLPLTLGIRVETLTSPGGLYDEEARASLDRGEPTTVEAVPFARWGNRTPGAMRVWLPEPRSSQPPTSDTSTGDTRLSGTHHQGAS